MLALSTPPEPNGIFFSSKFSLLPNFKMDAMKGNTLKEK
jgi:hypothetical protein